MGVGGLANILVRRAGSRSSCRPYGVSGGSVPTRRGADPAFGNRLVWGCSRAAQPGGAWIYIGPFLARAFIAAADARDDVEVVAVCDSAPTPIGPGAAAQAVAARFARRAFSAVPVASGTSVAELEWAKTRVAAACADRVLDALLRDERGVPQSGPAAYYGRAELRAVTTVGDPSTHAGSAPISRSGRS
jgi:hypothetical protein